MSDYLKISKDGILAFNYDAELRSKHRHRKNPDGTVLVINKETKEEIGVFENSDVTDELYWAEEKNKENWVSDLRTRVVLDEDLDFSDIVRGIRENKEFDTVCFNLFGDKWSQVSSDFIFSWHCEVDSHGVNISRKRTPGKFAIANQSTLDIDGEFHGEFAVDMAMIDLLECLFRSDDYQTVYFDKIDNELVLRSATGEQVDHFEFLFNNVEFLEEVSLNEIFEWVSKCDDLVDFFSLYSWCDVRAFHEEAQLPKSVIDPEFMEGYSKDFENVFVDQRLFFNKKDQKIWRTFGFYASGPISDQMRLLYKESGGECPEKDNYGISMCPAYHYSHLPFVVGDTILIDNGVNGSITHRKVDMRLIDILDSIYWEISFCGNPDQRDDFQNEVAERVEEIRDESDE